MANCRKTSTKSDEKETNRSPKAEFKLCNLQSEMMVYETESTTKTEVVSLIQFSFMNVVKVYETVPNSMDFRGRLIGPT